MFFHWRLDAVDREGANNQERHASFVYIVKIVTSKSTLQRFNDSTIERGEAIRHLCKHIGGAPRVIDNAVRLEQRRNHDHSLCSGINHSLQIVDVDSTDAEDGQTYLCMDAPDLRKPDRRIVRFCRRGEDRAEPDIVRAFAL